MCTQNGKFLKDVTQDAYVSKCISKSLISLYISTNNIPYGVNNVTRKAATNWGYYTYSSEFDCSVNFLIYVSTIIENYDINIENKNGMLTINYPYITGSDVDPYFSASTIKNKTITIAQENVTINYN